MDRPTVRILAAVAGALALAGCGSAESAVVTAPAPASSARGYRSAAALPAGILQRPVARIRLGDARGGVFDTARLRGRPYAVTFLYSTCPDVCPLIGAELRAALAALGPDARRYTVIAVSVDPRHDTAPAVRRWLEAHGEPSNFHYLIGRERELAPVWRAWHVAPQVPGDPRSAHTASIWLVDRHGRLAAILSAGTAVPTSDLVYDLRRLARE